MQQTNNEKTQERTHERTQSFFQKTHSFWNSKEHWNQLPLFYVIYTTLVALLGYYFILCFPMLFVVCVHNTLVLLPFYPITENLTETLWWITLSIFFGHISINILNIDFAAMPGLKIKRKSAGRLFQLLDDIKAEYPQPKIHQIIITEQFELKLVKIPRFGIPIFTHNTMVIGLPLMLTLSPNQFKCLLTREIIQYSKNRHKFANWFNQLRESWDRYRIVLKQRACIGHQVLYGFFTLYSPIYKAISLPAHINDELNADRNALDLINSDELLSAFQAKLIARLYIEKCFWPEISKFNCTVSPFSRLYRAAKTALSRNNSETWLQQQNLFVDNIGHDYPTLQQRMENLGSTSIKLPPDLAQTAADYYFQNHLAKIIGMSDNNWLEKRCNTYGLAHASHAGSGLFNSAVK
jgi:hypothetical protein